LSLGIQSLSDHELATLGRIHTAAEARDAIRYARASGFDNLNLDFIYGLPGQALSDWEHTLDDVLAMEPEHISLYALTLETDTPMSALIKKGSLPEIDPDICADQYELAEDKLAAHGYTHYEISNWARPGRTCRHNLTYWHNLPYLGIGAAAHSCIGGRRFANTSDIDKYIAHFTENKSLRPELDEEINPALEFAETVILGLRLDEGINADYLQHRFGRDLLADYGRQVEEMAGAGLLEHSNGHIRLTRRGRLLSNEVFWRFLPE
jgi:oxygen-independent coproporphyrinogen-3 oxidase